MIGLTPHEAELAEAAQGTGTGICLALAELELFWENHRANAPQVHELRMNLRIADEGTPEDRLAAVQAIADWLGVPVVSKNGCYIAQRRFGTGDDSVIIEAHFTPNPARAHLERAAAKDKAAGEDVTEDTRKLVAAA